MDVFCARWSGTGQQNAWGHSPHAFSVDFSAANLAEALASEQIYVTAPLSS